MATEAQRRANKKYDSTNTRQFHLKLNLNTDQDIIRQLERQDSTQGYIKQLIRRDIATPPRKYPPTRYSDTLYGCGICGHELTNEKACPFCGQTVDWS